MLGEVGGELAGEQLDVAAAVVQVGDVDLYGAEAVVEVFAEAPLGHGLLEVDVGGGHDADVGLLHLAGADLEELSALEHAEQARLGGEGELGHLVEEDGAAVGLLEVSLAGADGAGEGAFLVAEELRVDGPLGDGAAVDGNVFAVLAGREVVDDLGEELLSGAALAEDEDAEVDGGDAHGAVDGAQQQRRRADDAEPPLDVAQLLVARMKCHFFVDCHSLKSFGRAARASLQLLTQLLEFVRPCAEQASELLHGAAVALFLDCDGLADAQVYLPAAHAEHLGRQPQGAQAPVDDAQDVEESGIVAVEVDGNHRHLELADEADDGGLPLPVADVEVALYLADGAGREESERVAGLDVGDGLADALQRDALLLRVGRPAWVDRDEAGTHSRQVIEEEVDHHLVVGAEGPHLVQQHYAVEGPQGVVGDGDKGPGGEAAENLLVVHAHAHLELLLHQRVREWHARRRRPARVHCVDPVDLQEPEDGLDEPRLAAEEGRHAAHVLICQHLGPYVVALAVFVRIVNSLAHRGILACKVTQFSRHAAIAGGKFPRQTHEI